MAKKLSQHYFFVCATHKIFMMIMLLLNHSLYTPPLSFLFFSIYTSFSFHVH
ncbi:hypothetical protein BDC45DRAFT_513044, partial [Circinella umbellata]